MSKFIILSSMKHIERVEKLKDLLLKKYPDSEVITPNDVPWNRTHVPLEKSKNRQFYFDGIYEADHVILYVGDHVGIGTTLEIGYAISHHKHIQFTNFPPARGQEWDEIWALMVDKTMTKLTEHEIGGRMP